MLLASLTICLLACGVCAEFYKPYPDAGIDPVTFSCTLHPKVTEETFTAHLGAIQEMFAYACGRNRGIFVLNPPDGLTYGCGNFPTSWGVKNVGEIFSASPSVGLKAVRAYIEAVYETSIEKSIGGCDFNGLSVLKCGREKPWMTAPWYPTLRAPIRAVNIGGLFMLESWILPGFVEWGADTGIYDQYTFSENCHSLQICETLRDHWHNWYTQDDFNLMKTYNLNSVRIPVGYWYFNEISNFSPQPYLLPVESIFSSGHPLTKIIKYAFNAGLQVILDLHGAPGGQNGFDTCGRASDMLESNTWGEKWIYDQENLQGTVRTLGAMATYINILEASFGLNNVMAIELLNEPWVELDLGKVRQFYEDAISEVRKARPELPIILHDSFRPHRWDTLFKNFAWNNVFFDTHVYLGFAAADVASATEADDRLKMYVHEEVACAYAGSLRWQTCSAMPTLVGEWSLAIENCMDKLDPRLKNYGQCESSRLSDRLSSPWWVQRYASLAQRQISTFENELGWAFWTWKLDDVAETTITSSVWWSFHQAVSHGFINTSYPDTGCLWPPSTNFSESLSGIGPIVNGNESILWALGLLVGLASFVGALLVLGTRARARRTQRYTEIPDTATVELSVSTHTQM